MMRRKRGGATLPCPKCGGTTRVKETRRVDEQTIKRLRVCRARRCKTELISHEQYVERR